MILKVCHLLALAYRGIQMLQYLVMRPNRDLVPGVQVCVTTYPARNRIVGWALLSLIHQQRVSANVTLFVSCEEYANERSLPRLVRALKRRGWVEIEICEGENERSFKKLMPALRARRDQIVITFDDDVIYASDVIERLLEGAERHPKSVIGTRGVEIQLMPSGELAPYQTWPRGVTETESFSVLLTGVGGILYPPKITSGDFVDFSTAKVYCPDADDIWFKHCALIQGIRCTVVAGGDPFLTLPFSRRRGLHVGNVRGNGNDESISRLRVDFDDKYCVLLKDEETWSIAEH